MSLPATTPRDRLARPLRDLRVSVTDRCNLRCRYCMPREIFGPRHAFLERRELLTFEEIARLVRVFTGLGVEKVRVTGGEPLVRRDLPDLIGMLSPLPGVKDLCLTTNGVLLPRHAPELARAGLRRVTVSLDSLDDAVFMRMNDSGVPVAAVLAGIEAAEAAGLSPVKINAVIQRGVNEEAILELARRFHGTGHIVRFIEYMDVGSTNGWTLDEVVPAGEIVARIGAEMPLEPAEATYPGEVARRWRYAGGGGEIGVIASVTRPFCGGCTRARLSPEGKLFTCLFAGSGHDLRPLVRSSASDHDLAAALEAIWTRRDDRYSELRAAGAPGLPRVEMSYIGG
jgi:cyclic pyranopterin phosphate synthase